MDNSSYYVAVWQQIKRKPFAMAGGIVIVIFLFLALFAQYLTPYTPDALDLYHVLMPPSLDHLCGTDELGRDVFTRMLYGTRISLLVGFVSVGIAVVIGILLGVVAGYYGKWIDSVIMRFIDIMLCFPTFFLILAVLALLDKPSIWYIMLIIGLTSWMGVARLVRAEVLSLKERDFILAARSLGASNIRIIWVHLIPNALSPVIVYATLGIAGAIITESALSYLGIGVQPPTPSWGNILTSGKDYIEFGWWLSLFPGIAIFLTALSYNLLGEGLRDALDPRTIR